MNLNLPALFRPFSFHGRCTRSAYWWRVVVLNLAVLPASLFLFEAAFTADGAVSLSDAYTTAALSLMLAITWLMAPPMALLTLPLFGRLRALYLLCAPSQPEAQDSPAPVTE